MLLIADSGSSKTDWLLSQPDGSFKRLTSQGLNPYVVLPEDFNYIVRKTISEHLHDVTAVKFYGSGCTPEMIPQVTNTLKDIFWAAEVQVYSDLVAAAHASLGQKAGIIAILGTGSNSGYFNGETITQNVPSLGYLLGDEGSGNWMGKKLLRDYLRGSLPLDLKKKLEEFQDVSQAHVFHKIYKEPAPNAFLGSFTHFIKDNIDHPYCSEVVKRGFTKFIEQCLLKYPNVFESEVGIIGSVAAVFSDILKSTLEMNDITNYTIIQSPIKGLQKYYSYD